MIFISYSRRDLETAKQLVDSIQQQTGVDCWIDMEGIESASQFEDVIVSAIDKSEAVLFLYSKNSKKSVFAKKEISYAINSKKRVVPVCIDDTTLDGWFLFKFGDIDCIDYTNSDQRTKLLNDLNNWFSHDYVPRCGSTVPIVEKKKPLTWFSIIILLGALVVLAGLICTCIHFGYIKGNKDLSHYKGTLPWKNIETIPLLFNYLVWIFAADFCAVLLMLVRRIWSPMIVVIVSYPMMIYGLFKHIISLQKMGYTTNTAFILAILAGLFVGILSLSVFLPECYKRFKFWQ